MSPDMKVGEGGGRWGGRWRASETSADALKVGDQMGSAAVVTSAPTRPGPLLCGPHK